MASEKTENEKIQKLKNKLPKKCKTSPELWKQIFIIV